MEYKDILKLVLGGNSGSSAKFYSWVFQIGTGDHLKTFLWHQITNSHEKPTVVPNVHFHF